MTEDGKMVVRCGRCALNQYLTKNSYCRRCGYELTNLAALAELTPPELFWGRRLRHIRAHRRLSQRDLARLIGRGRSFIAKLERRTSPPREYTCLLLAAGLKIEADIFVEDPQGVRELIQESLMRNSLVCEFREAGSGLLTADQIEIVLFAMRSLLAGQMPLIEYSEVQSAALWVAFSDDAKK